VTEAHANETTNLAGVVPAIDPPLALNVLACRRWHGWILAAGLVVMAVDPLRAEFRAGIAVRNVTPDRSYPSQAGRPSHPVTGKAAS